MNKEVFMLGLYDTGLYTGQLFGEAGVDVTGIDCDLSKPGFYSRYIRAILGPDPVTHEIDLVDLLIRQSRNKSIKPLLIASSELYLGFLHRQRDLLREYFDFDIPDSQVMERVLIKSGQFVMAANSGYIVPDYVVIKNDSDLAKLSSLTSFPVIVKSDNQLIWKSNKLSKSYVALNRSSLYQKAQDLLSIQVPFIAQTLISGPITNNYEYNSFCLEGKIIAESVVQKKRQYPVPYGAATMVELVQNSTVSAMGKKFVLDNGIEGFSNTEFKYNDSTRQWFFIETNARVWLQIKLTRDYGVNYALEYLHHKNIINRGAIVKQPTKYHAKWMDLFGEFMVLRNVGSLSALVSMLISYHGISSLGLLNLQDIRPFINVLRHRRGK